jgi:hypothetical protein
MFYLGRTSTSGCTESMNQHGLISMWSSNVDQKTQFSSSMERFLVNGNFQFFLMLKSLD